jgi:hypothetical protein
MDPYSPLPFFLSFFFFSLYEALAVPLIEAVKDQRCGFHGLSRQKW